MKKLLDETADDLTRALLEAGRSHRPPATNQAKLLVTLGVGAGVGLFSSKAFAWLSTSAGKLTLLGVGIAGVVYTALPGAPGGALPGGAGEVPLQARSNLMVSVPRASEVPGLAPLAAPSPVAGGPGGVSLSGGPVPGGPTSDGSAAGGLAASGPFSGGPVAGGPVAGGPVAGGPVAGGPFAGGPFAGGPVAGGPVAGGPAGAAGPSSLVVPALVDAPSEPRPDSVSSSRVAHGAPVRREHAPAASQSPRRVSKERKSTAARRDDVGEPLERLAEGPLPAASPPPPAVGAPSPAALEPAEVRVSGLESEIQLVDAMRGAAQRNDATELRRLVDDYRGAFPEGQLRQEVSELSLQVLRPPAP